MWNLSAEDVQRAKEELKGRRAAIQARYENELKQLESDIADLETFERFAVRFVSDFKGEEPTAAAEPVPAASEAAAEAVADAVDAASPAEAEAASLDSASTRKGASRWRMHLNPGEAASA